MSRNVLIVDDERECLELASISLRLFGDFEVFQAINGEAALQKAGELHPDVILLDYYLEDTTGGDLIKALRSNPALRQIPIVVYSGSPQAAKDDPNITEDIQILAKPLNPESLSAVLAKICSDSGS